MQGVKLSNMNARTIKAKGIAHSQIVIGYKEQKQSHEYGEGSHIQPLHLSDPPLL